MLHDPRDLFSNIFWLFLWCPFFPNLCRQQAPKMALKSPQSLQTLWKWSQNGSQNRSQITEHWNFMRKKNQKHCTAFTFWGFDPPKIINCWTFRPSKNKPKKGTLTNTPQNLCFFDKDALRNTIMSICWRFCLQLRGARGGQRSTFSSLFLGLGPRDGPRSPPRGPKTSQDPPRIPKTTMFYWFWDEISIICSDMFCKYGLSVVSFLLASWWAVCWLPLLFCCFFFWFYLLTVRCLFPSLNEDVGFPIPFYFPYILGLL